jgi:hypothetical protein
MAKRKLSPDQREAIRKEMRQGMAQKKKTIDIINAASEKYGITTITARWYLKSLSGGRKRASTRRPKQSRRVSRRRGRRPGVRLTTNGSSLRIVQQVTSVADKTLKRALEAKKLIPKWQVYVRKEASLRQLESKLKVQLRRVSSKASALHRRIQALTPK